METFRAKRVLDRPSLVLIVVETVSFQSHRSGAGCGFSAAISPVALVICTPAATQALDLNGRPVELDALRRQVPVLDDELASFALHKPLI